MAYLFPSQMRAVPSTRTFATGRESPIVPSQAKPRKKSICSMSGLKHYHRQAVSRTDSAVTNPSADKPQNTGPDTKISLE
jgi:hypothetical protein